MKREANEPRRAEKKKISRVSIVDQVCSVIKQEIADGIWKEGDKLPSEAELAESFGVNRLSVRMALQKLITLGLIETRVGEGSFIRPFSLKPFLMEIAPFYEDETRYREVQQLRYLLETECMKQAVKSAGPEEKEELSEALRVYREASLRYSEDMENQALLEQLVSADFDFHYKTVKMSHNRLYKDVYFMVQQLIRSHITSLVSQRMKRRKAAGLQPLIEEENDTHCQIYRAIINGDEETINEMCQDMLNIRPVKDMDIFE